MEFAEDGDDLLLEAFLAGGNTLRFFEGFDPAQAVCLANHVPPRLYRCLLGSYALLSSPRLRRVEPRRIAAPAGARILSSPPGFPPLSWTFSPDILDSVDVAAKILVCVTGGIAAYKAPGVIRRLRESNRTLKTAATPAAFRFIPEETLAIATGAPIHTDETWWERSGKVEHITLARWADLVLIAPATADSMARTAIGLGDDLVSATILAGAKNVLWAPAMNPEMWSNPATVRNVKALKSWGHRFVGPAEGPMASTDEVPGVGRLADEAEIVAAVEEALAAGLS